MLNKKAFVFGLAIFALGPHAALAAGTKVSIGYVTAVDFLPALVSQETGCYAENGIEAELIRIQVATNIPAALTSNTMQIGMSTATILLPAAENGLDLVAVAGSSRLKKGNEGISLVVRDGVQIDDAKAAVGKKIGVPGILSTGDLIFRKWLKNNGVDPASVTFVETPFPRMKDMIKAGTVDGVLAAEPVRSMITGDKTGGRSKSEYYSAVSPDSLLTIWISNGAWAKANPKIVQAFRTCLDKSIAWIKANGEQSKEVEKKYFRFNTGTTADWTSDVTSQDLDFYLAVSKEFDLVRKNIDTSKLIFKP